MAETQNWFRRGVQNPNAARASKRQGAAFLVSAILLLNALIWLAALLTGSVLLALVLVLPLGLFLILKFVFARTPSKETMTEDL